MPKKRIAPMWLVKNDEGKNVFFHYSDSERAKQYGEPIMVFVIMDYLYFIDTWQFEETITGYIGYYYNLEEAEDGMTVIGGYEK